MKTYKVCIKTTFLKWYKVQAENREEAAKIGYQLIENDNTIDTDILESEVAEVL